MLLDFGENPVVKCEALPYNKRNNSFISIFFPIGKRMLLPIGRAMEAMKRKKGLSENMLENRYGAPLPSPDLRLL